PLHHSRPPRASVRHVRDERSHRPEPIVAQAERNAPTVPRVYGDARQAQCPPPVRPACPPPPPPPPPHVPPHAAEAQLVAGSAGQPLHASVRGTERVGDCAPRRTSQ